MKNEFSLIVKSGKLQKSLIKERSLANLLPSRFFESLWKYVIMYEIKLIGIISVEFQGS